MEPWSPEWKEEQLRLLAEDWGTCDGCELADTRQHVVFGVGNPDADILFCGEAPGEDEDNTGIPFVGESGNLFKALLSRAGINWDDIYITNIVGCRPPKNRDPLTAERDACLGRLQAIIYTVDPLLVVPVGKFALKALAKGRDWAITEHHGVLFSSPHPTMKYTGERNSVEIPGHVFPRTGDDKKKYALEYEMIPILHPAYLLREDSFDKEKKKFQPGGWTEQTLNHLKHIKEYVDALQEEYASIPTIRS